MQALPIKKDVRKPTGQLRIKNARANNLKNISVDIPKGVLTAVTGVVGSGISSLVNEVLLVQHPGAIVIDQSAVGTSTRSNPATYTGVMDDLRKAFASANKVDPGLFSFNSKGACEGCNGSGVVYTDLAFLDAFKSPCEVCQGRRVKDEVLAYKLDGKSISDVLAMTVAQAVELFRKRKEIVRKLQAMHDVGLAYLTLGSTASVRATWHMLFWIRFGCRRFFELDRLRPVWRRQQFRLICHLGRPDKLADPGADDYHPDVPWHRVLACGVQATTSCR